MEDGFTILLTVKSRIVSLTFLITKNIVLFPACSKLLIKLIYFIGFGAASRTCCLLLSIAISSFVSSMDNKASNQLYSPLLNLKQFSKCWHMFLYHLLLANWKSSNHKSCRCGLLFCPLEESIMCVLFWPHYLPTIKKSVGLMKIRIS